MRDMTIVGPVSVTGVSETVSRRRVFTCRPTTVLEEEPCAAPILRDLVSRAYRGKGTAQGTADAMQFYLDGRRTGDFEDGIRLALQSILVSPLFVFRLERTPAAAAPEPRTASPTTTWPRGCRSSSGAPGRTRS